MIYDYDQKKQLLQLAKLMREGNKQFPKKIKCSLFGLKDNEACSLGCVASILNPEARDKYFNSKTECIYDLLEKTFPVLETVSPIEPIDSLMGWIFDLNDMDDLPILEIADKIEALTYEKTIS
ncbi:MAG TPA: hypothetical protein VNX68_10925 [Nitrosopumilaceae archaeon]|jgi:hypothetical protein|nr:hypothetical protein [Nitrosopumilaceae archaeon]